MTRHNHPGFYEAGRDCERCRELEPVMATSESEALRKIHAGRPIAQLREARIFDKERAEESPLFAPHKPRLF